MSIKNRTGGTVDELWEEMGLLESIEELTIRRMLAAELARTMKRRGIGKAELARQMDTSRPQLDRLLDPFSKGGITVHTLAKAARVVGKRLKVELVASR